MDNYLIECERYGKYSLECVIASTYVLNILKLLCDFEKKATTHGFHREAVKIRKILDINKIKKSYSILFPLMQNIFANAVDEINQISDCFNDKLQKLNI